MNDQTGSYRASEYEPQPGQPGQPGPAGWSRPPEQPVQPGYGEPVPGQWAPAPPQGSYGQVPQYSASQPYGGPQYGPPPQYGSYGPPQQFHYGPPPARPGGGTVITAGVIQIVQASLFVFIALGILLIADVVNSTGDEVDRQLGSDVSDTTDSVSRWVAIGGLLLLAGAVFMIVLAALAMRGRRWAAITSVVLQALSIVGTLVSLAQSDAGDSPGFGVVFLLASVAVVVFFLLPASSAYFADRSAARAVTAGR